MPISSIGFRPKQSDSLPYIGIAAVLVTRYEVTTQV